MPYNIDMSKRWKPDGGREGGREGEREGERNSGVFLRWSVMSFQSSAVVFFARNTQNTLRCLELKVFSNTGA